MGTGFGEAVAKEAAEAKRAATKNLKYMIKSSCARSKDGRGDERKPGLVEIKYARHDDCGAATVAKAV